METLKYTIEEIVADFNMVIDEPQKISVDFNEISVDEANSLFMQVQFGTVVLSEEDLKELLEFIDYEEMTDDLDDLEEYEVDYSEMTPKLANELLRADRKDYIKLSEEDHNELVSILAA